MEFIKDIIERETQAIKNIPQDENIIDAINLIHKQVHENGGKLVVSGMGKAGQIGVNMATTFSSTGTPAVFIHPSEAQHGDLGIMQKNDVLLLISNSGKTREILEFVMLNQNLFNNPIIEISKSHDTDLAKQADVSLSTGDPKEVCILGLAPTTSTTCMTVLGDIMVVGLMDKIKFDNVEYSKRHHGGYLGQKSKENIKTK
jgi:arabinose-5-phosphate isomerase